MEGSQEYLFRRSSFAYVLVVLAGMLFADLLLHTTIIQVLVAVPVIGFLAILLYFGWAPWLFVFMSIALSLYLSSITLASLGLIPLYTLLLLRSINELPSLPPPSDSVIGPASGSILRVAPLFLFASVSYYRIILPVVTLVATILIIVFIQYLRLSRFSVLDIKYNHKVVMGSRFSVKLTTRCTGGCYIYLSIGGVSKLISVEGKAISYISWKPPTVGRYSLILKILILDSWLVSGKLVAKVPVTFVVLPSYVKEIRRVRHSQLIPTNLVTEPVQAKVFIIGSGKGSSPLGGLGDAWHYLKLLPRFLRQFAEAILTSPELVGIDKELVSRWYTRGLYGDYRGLREFVAGDILKLIHWKKSISLRRIVVKEFVAVDSIPPGSVGSGNISPIIVADLTSESVRELDSIIAKVLGLMYRVAQKANSTSRETLLLLIFGDMVVALKGVAESLLTKVTSSFSDILPQSTHDYDSLDGRVSDSMVGTIIASRGCCRLVDAVIASSLSYAGYIVRIFIKEGALPPNNVIIVHGKPTTLRNSVLARQLKAAGYQVVFLRSDMS